MTKLKMHIKNEKRWKKTICKILKCNNFDLKKVSEHKYATFISRQPDNSCPRLRRFVAVGIFECKNKL